MELTSNKREFLCLYHKADTTGKIIAVAILCSIVGYGGEDLIAEYTRGDFKRAIKALRENQMNIPQYAAYCNEAIAHIRLHWLGKEVAANV